MQETVNSCTGFSENNTGKMVFHSKTVKLIMGTVPKPVPMF